MTQPPAPPRVRRSERRRLEDEQLAQQAQQNTVSAPAIQTNYDASSVRPERTASDAYTPPPYGAAYTGGACVGETGQGQYTSQPAAQTAYRGLPSAPKPTLAAMPAQQQARVNRFSPEALSTSLGAAYETPPTPAAPTRGTHRQHSGASPSPEPPAARAQETDARQRARTARGMAYAAVGAIALLVMIFAGMYIGATARLTRITREREEAASAYETLVNRHTVKYRDLVQRYAKENNLQPAYVAAIILRESSYDPDAVSSAGARGLMQLMPDTAEWIAEKLNLANFSFDMMFDPETNIRFGTWYLGYLSGAGQFAGDPVLMACAYHAGQGNVRSWLGRYAGADGTLSIDEIPMSDTRSYAQKVLNAYAIYAQHAYVP